MSRRSISLLHPRRILRDDFIDSFWESPLSALGVNTYALDMYETDDHVVVEIEAPGFNASNVEITVEDKNLTVTGSTSREQQDEDAKKKYYYQEISKQSFTRSVQLPTRVNAEKAEATFANGIIKIALPKMEDAKPRKINVKAT